MQSTRSHHVTLVAMLTGTVAPPSAGASFDGAAPVKQLEHAMTKLLPEGQPGTATSVSANTDFSTDALLKQHSRAPSIHWIGNNPSGELGEHKH